MEGYNLVWYNRLLNDILLYCTGTARKCTTWYSVDLLEGLEHARILTLILNC